MKVGDLVWFRTGFTGLIVEITDSRATVFVTGEEEISFVNPTSVLISTLKRSAKVISEKTNS
tara:strand:- start:384 stop:569 length:186 start_codon:yes stop_codon:yes gene_type:complete